MLRCSRHLLLNLEDSMQRKSRGGSVVLDKRSKVWNFYWWEAGKRRSKKIGHVREFPTKISAWKATKALRDQLENEAVVPNLLPKVGILIARYRAERMPTRHDTRRSYEVWISNHILPKWGNCELSEIEPRPVELWLQSLALAPKSKAHIRGVLRILWDFAAYSGDVPKEQRNPMELVRIKGSSKRTRRSRSLTVEEFQRFTRHLMEPFRTMALLCCCLGLRISECLALRWSDVDWLGHKLLVERGIVCQQVDDVKTAESRKKLTIAGELLTALHAWRQTTQFPKPEDWIFASPVQVGRLPWSYDQVWRMYQKAAGRAGIGGLGTHALRHTYRSWLDSVGTPLGVQQRLMRHTDIRTTMNVYGEAATEDMSEAHGKIVGLAFNGRENGM
jgi:integrase